MTPLDPQARPEQNSRASQNTSLRDALLFAFAFSFVLLHFTSLPFAFRFTPNFDSNRTEFRSPHADGSADYNVMEWAGVYPPI